MSTKTPQPRPMTIRDFARHLGVSKTTVSKAFTGNGRIAPGTRETILNAARAAGFGLNPHAQRLAVGRSADLVSLFTPDPSYAGTSGQKSLRIQQILASQGFDVPLYGTGRIDFQTAGGQVEAIRRILRQRPRAIICAMLTLPDAAFDLLRSYQAEGGVVIGYDVPVAFESDSVLFDREDNAFQATRHLLDLGHRRIGVYLVGSRQAGDRFLLPRLAGFRRALAEYSLVECPEWNFEGGVSEADGAFLAERFLRLGERPTGIYVTNETVATVFINTLLRAGVRVPQDVSVASSDDLPVARYAVVPLTTASAPIEEIAQRVAFLLTERLCDPSRPFQQMTVRGDLIRRDSTGVPPPGASLRQICPPLDSEPSGRPAASCGSQKNGRYPGIHVSYYGGVDVSTKSAHCYEGAQRVPPRGGATVACGVYLD